jgi:hypothetical protein
LPPHHIFCGGPYAIPFARLGVEILNRCCPGDLASQLRVHIHLEGLPYAACVRAAAWIAEAPRTVVTCNLLGIKPGKRISGYWHQVMINDTCHRHAYEPWLAFVDADNYLLDDTWFRFISSADLSGVFCVTQGVRTDRCAAVGECVYYACKTYLLALPPLAHERLCDQRHNKDTEGLERLRLGFPHARITLNKDMDTMVQPSLKAQLLGLRMIDIEGKVPAAHVGGFSHIDTKKFDQAGRNSMWITRLRLNNRVLRTFLDLGWAAHIDPDYAERLANMTRLVESTTDLRILRDTLPPTTHETNFERIRKEVLGLS